MAGLVFTETDSSFNYLTGWEVARLVFEIYVGNATLGSLYAAGGIAVTTALIDSTLPAAASILQVLCAGSSVDGLHTFSWDSVNSKIQMYDIADGTEETATDVSAANLSFSMIVFIAPGE